MSFRNLAALAFAVAVLASLAAPAAAANVGVRGGVYTETDEAFVGAELLSNVGHHFYFNPNAEYIFVDSGQFWTFNFDAHYDIPMQHHGPYLWLGGGLAVLYHNPEGTAESDTSAHANLLAGIGFRTHSGLVPYIQVKLITSDPSEFVAAGGLRF